jgi:hypothetical protein
MGEPSAQDRAEALLRLFAGSTEPGHVRAVAAAAVPEPARTLLDHARHMTDAQERFHGGPVELRVLGVVSDGPSYAREILLARPDGRVVQYGIVRIDMAALDTATAERIRRADTPLGRILADAGMLCAVGGVQLVEFVPGPRLAAHMGPQPRFGRVADIRVADVPAVELLEVVVTE